MESQKLDTKKKLFIECLCTPGDGGSLKERALAAGITERQFTKWMRDPGLLRIAFDDYKKEIMPRLPKILSALVAKAEDGDINAIKMVFQQLENFQNEPQASQGMTPEDIIRIIREKNDE